MTISLSGSNIVPFTESNTTPAASYTSQGINIRLFSLIICSDSSLWICINNADQSALVWKNIQYAS